MRYRLLDTCTGPFLVTQDDDGVIGTSWLDPGDQPPAGACRDDGLLPELTRRLEAYFAGEPVHFDDVPLPPGPDFSRRCWSACRTISRGRTRSYAELASLAGSPDAARAAGQAMRRNPIPVIVPCHRVLASGGRLGGFAGSVDTAGLSLGRKRTLLTLEGAVEPSLFGPTSGLGSVSS